MMIFLSLFILLILVIIQIRNSIIRHHNATIRAWSDVASFERQKVKILDHLESLVIQYTHFEKDTLSQVTALRQNILNLKINEHDISTLQHIEALNQQLMHNLSVVVENYPELKTNTLYLKMMHEIEQQNENVGASIIIYNRNVELFNNYIQIFPNNIINTATIAKKQVRAFQDQTITQSFDYRPNF